MATEATDRRGADLPVEVQELLRLGPFHEALKAAIGARNLTLERLEARLGANGFRIGRSTLSYWQQGRRRPERPDSLEALTALEEILNVRPGALTALLGPRKPRGRWINHRIGVLGWADMWAMSDDIRRLVAIDNRRNNERLQDISLTESFQIGSDRRMQWLQIDTVTQAVEAGADRMLLLFNADPDVDASRIAVADMEDCRIGRYRSHAESNIVVFEMLFDRRLAEGDTHVYSFRVNFSDAFLSETELAHRQVKPSPTTQGLRAFRRTSNAYVVKARFAADALPVRCFHMQSTRISGSQQIVDEIGLSAQGSAHVAIQNVQPGVHGIAWEWE